MNSGKAKSVCKYRYANPELSLGGNTQKSAETSGRSHSFMVNNPRRGVK